MRGDAFGFMYAVIEEDLLKPCQGGGTVGAGVASNGGELPCGGAAVGGGMSVVVEAEPSIQILVPGHQPHGEGGGAGGADTEFGGHGGGGEATGEGGQA